MHRLNIYSNRKQTHLKQSVSTGNINCVGSDDFVMKLGSKLSLLKNQEEAFEIIDEKEEETHKVAEKPEEDNENNKPRKVFLSLIQKMIKISYLFCNSLNF